MRIHHNFLRKELIYSILRNCRLYFIATSTVSVVKMLNFMFNSEIACNSIYIFIHSF